MTDLKMGDRCRVIADDGENSERAGVIVSRDELVYDAQGVPYIRGRTTPLGPDDVVLQSDSGQFFVVTRKRLYRQATAIPPGMLYLPPVNSPFRSWT